MSVALSPLTAALRAEVLALETDLRARVHDQPTLAAEWQAVHREALDAGRTATSYAEWRDERITQAAVGWVLVTVFVRFCEDSGLVDPVWIGPPHRYAEALDSQSAYFREHPRAGTGTGSSRPSPTSPACPPPPGSSTSTRRSTSSRRRGRRRRTAARVLAAAWGRREAGLGSHRPAVGHPVPGRSLPEPVGGGAGAVRPLQTPHFVEEFILDRTLEPALRERSLEGFTVIDPTCGSGHFLLGAFDRVLDRWHRHAPGLDPRERVQQALDAIHGVDLNPYAVTIARFRLTLAALRASGMDRLADAPAFRYHIAVGDSLSHGESAGTFDGMSDASRYLRHHTYATEDADVLGPLLADGRYDVVVGNPPYITVKDKALNDAYRALYKTCQRQYAMTVPFMERFFHLTRPGGHVGQITSNSFMKREFGTKFIEEFFPRVDLREVVDTSGAYIPGHGTPPSS